MTSKLAEAALWQRKVASLISSGLLERAQLIDAGGLFKIVGVYGDGAQTAPLAKYADRRRAEDALEVLERLIARRLLVGEN